MSPTDAEGIAAAALVIAIAGLIAGLAYYVWYATALSKTFPKLASEGWKGWVPVLNEAEILRIGGEQPWSVIFYFLPVVQFYGLYLKVKAVHRINLQFQRGTGMTVLGILLPPVWASILAWGRTPVSHFDQRVAATLPGQPTVGVGPLSAPLLAPPLAPRTPDLPGFVVPQPAEGAPVVPEPVLPAPTAPVDEVQSPPRPAFIVNPWAPQSAEATAAPEAPAAIVPPSIRVVSPPPVDVPAAAVLPAAEAPVIPEPLVPPAPAPIALPDPAPQVVDGPVSEPVAHADEDEDEDEFAATVVVDRRPRVLWQLVLANGTRLDLTADTVALGRNPASEDPETQLLAVPDSTRTLSKTHATLTLSDGHWTVTDLNSTNGVIVVGAEDAETLLAPGRSALVPDRFILGKVGMRIEFDEGTPR